MTISPPPTDTAKLAGNGDEERLIIEVDGEQIAVDESTMDFSDLTADEIRFVHDAFGASLLGEDGEPTADVAAAFITLKLARGRGWTQAHIEAVLTLLHAWLTDNLVEAS